MSIVQDIQTKRKWNIIWNFYEQRWFVYKHGKFVKSFETNWDEANSWIIATEECED